MSNKEIEEVELDKETERLLQKAIIGDSLTEDEWKELVQQCRDYYIEEVTDDESCSRWYDWVTVIFKYKGKFYGITFGEGKTEYQENDYSCCTIDEYHKVTKIIEKWEVV